MMNYLIESLEIFESIKLLEYTATENRVILEFILTYLIGVEEKDKIMPKLQKESERIFKNMYGEEDDGKEE